MIRHTSLAGIAAVAALLAAGCSDSKGSDKAANAVNPSQSTASSRSTSTPTGMAEVDLPVAAGADVNGLVTVNGHDLAVHCTGSGHPTVIILHGWIDEPGVTSFGYYGPLTDALKPDFRTCSYDRANVGDSETVPGTQTPEMVVGDLDGLMETLNDPGPYVLIGQSAGGMVASAYAVAHPEKVAGIVNLDGDFDDEVTLEDIVPPGMGACDRANRRIDSTESLQKIDTCAMYRWAYQRQDRRPEVPLAYLAARQAPWSDMAELGPRYTQSIVPLQKSYAHNWSPGKFVWVDSGHEIHAEQPAVVAEAVQWVVQEGGT